MKLYLQPDSDFDDWRCRDCHDLSYKKQYEKTRFALIKEFRRLHGLPDRPGSDENLMAIFDAIRPPDMDQSIPE